VVPAFRLFGRRLKPAATLSAKLFFPENRKPKIENLSLASGWELG
jgi:hypothetical protein